MNASPTAGLFRAIRCSRSPAYSLLLIVYITTTHPHDSSECAVVIREYVQERQLTKHLSEPPRKKKKKLGIAHDGIPLSHY